MSEIFKDDMNKIPKWEMPKWIPIQDEFDAFEHCYKLPIEMITSDYDRFVKDGLMQSVRQVGFNIDEKELLKALQYDRNQYAKGYADAKKKYQRPKGKWILKEYYVPVEQKSPSTVARTVLDRYSTPTAVESIYLYTCNFCKNEYTSRANYCPNCGAEMEE